MTSRKSSLIYIIMYSLLSLLPVVADGQTNASIPSDQPMRPRVLQKQGAPWWQTLYQGGMSRAGQWYVDIPDGLGDFIVMNFVDGYSYGPHATFGYIASDRSRWELEETVRWASAREVWMAKGALRWLSPAELGIIAEVYGGRHTEDFDRHPSMPTSHSLMATGLFGWNHYKLLERSDAGVRLDFPLGGAIDLKLQAGWERRKAMSNHKRTNVFGAHAQSNEPRLRDGRTASREVLYDGPVDGELALLSAEVNVQGGRRLYVYDDMTSRLESAYPLFSLRADAGMGRWHYLSLDLSVRQDVAMPLSSDRLQYMVSGGAIFRHGEIGLADWHHFDASCFWWQDKPQLTRFVMLDNYELSTDSRWLEGHAEWSSGSSMLLTRAVRNPGLVREYLQLHAVKVPTHRVHCELQYGIEFVQTLRLGVAVGFDGKTCRGAAFTMSLDIQSARNLQK